MADEKELEKFVKKWGDYHHNIILKAFLLNTTVSTMKELSEVLLWLGDKHPRIIKEWQNIKKNKEK